jgi:thiosulfate/3-mercaptopyruvate sulfurtransferase
VLIAADDLRHLVESGEAPTLLDVRWRLGGPGRSEYEAGHVPGARFVDLDTELAGPPGAAGRHPMPAAEAFTASMRAAGVSAGRPVVCYDAADSMSAARCWWLLTYFGHPAVSVLDGGYAAWVAGGGSSESGPDERLGPPGDFTAVPGGLGLLDTDGAARLARAGRLLDARAGPRYRGEVEPVDDVAGHIPGALSAPTADNLGESRRFRSPEALRARFAALGADGSGGPVGAYCGSGVTAAHEVLALRLAGIEAALYVGSWSEWSRDPARPIAAGPDPG